MPRIAVTGASGFLGRAVSRALLARGAAITALSRDPSRAGFPAGIRAARFDPADPAPNPEPFEGHDAVIHLAAATIAGRWTVQKKAAIWDSRVKGTRALVASLAACARKPRVLISASGAGFYGSRGDEQLDETSAPGDDFLAKLCVAWEAEALAAGQLGIRVTVMRQGVVFGTGGPLPRMAAPFRWFVGGPLGSGKQWFPWIHVDDLTSLFAYAIEHDDLAGPVNAVSPDAATSERIAAGIGRALHRPSFARAPDFALRLVLGEFAESLLASEKIKPARALAAGFIFRNADLETALAVLLG